MDKYLQSINFLGKHTNKRNRTFTNKLSENGQNFAIIQFFSEANKQETNRKKLISLFSIIDRSNKLKKVN